MWTCADIARRTLLPLFLGLVAACNAPGSESSAASGSQLGESSRAPLRLAFEQARDALLTFAAPFAAAESTVLVVEINEGQSDFRAKADSIKASPEESARGARFRRRIVVSAGTLADSSLTADGLAVILCHELGHHYGGYPFQKSDQLTTAEGSADYFATRLCAPVVMKSVNAGGRAPAAPDARAARERCRTSADSPLCTRIALASLSVVRALHARGEESQTAPPYATSAPPPSLDREDTFEVARTVGGAYPSFQCRLDTFVRGALCGLQSSRSAGAAPPPGSEELALTQSCSSTSFEDGARPRCWFREGSVPTTAADPDEIVWKSNR